MNLKEAFRYQNRLSALMQQAKLILQDDDNITQTEVIVYRSKVDPQAEDETNLTTPATDYSGQINEIVGFLLWLLKQREKLSRAIRRAKAELDFDMDGEVSLNKDRQELASILRHMADLKSSERLLSGGGRGYRFNTDGNQVTYVCDMKRITTINYDRGLMRNTCAELNRRADAVSGEIDLSLVNSNVDFSAPFDVNESFDGVFSIYLASR